MNLVETRGRKLASGIQSAFKDDSVKDVFAFRASSAGGHPQASSDGRTSFYTARQFGDNAIWTLENFLPAIKRE